MLARNPFLTALAALALALALAACGDARPVEVGTGGGAACTGCHGDGSRVSNMGGTDSNLAAAPPVAPAGWPAQPIQAHQAHLNPAATGSLAGPIACSECHLVPTDVSHATSPPAQIVHFGPLATAPVVPADGTNPGTPTWNSTDKVTNTTCSNVYCHGSFSWTGSGQGGANVVGNLTNKPDWTKTNQAVCGSCHDLPPAGHITFPGTVACSGCHPGTVDASYNIIVDIATGQSLHVNGRIDEGAHPDANWYVDPALNPSFTPVGGDHTVKALDHTPPSTGVAGCLQCHQNYDSPIAANDPLTSCNACHTARLVQIGAATTDWQQNCVFCHGDKSKLLTYAVADQASDPWIIAPPTGPQGETLATDVHVGAHQKHVNPAVNTLSSVFSCSECHTASLPVGIAQPDHLSPDGIAPVQLTGLIATAGGVQGSYASPSCSATYCHGNFTGGNNAAPAWNGDSTNSTCTSCHGVTGDPNGIAPRTGRHPTNWALHASFGNNCQYCHNTVATGSTTGTPSITAAGQALHVNGTRDVSFSFGSTTWTPNATGYGGTCSNVACHPGNSTETW